MKFIAAISICSMLASVGASNVQKTRKGCTCSGQCSATVDFGAAKFDCRSTVQLAQASDCSD